MIASFVYYVIYVIYVILLLINMKIDKIEINRAAEDYHIIRTADNMQEALNHLIL